MNESEKRENCSIFSRYCHQSTSSPYSPYSPYSPSHHTHHTHQTKIKVLQWLTLALSCLTSCLYMCVQHLSVGPSQWKPPSSSTPPSPSSSSSPSQQQWHPGTVFSQLSLPWMSFARQSHQDHLPLIFLFEKISIVIVNIGIDIIFSRRETKVHATISLKSITARPLSAPFLIRTLGNLG